MAEAKYQGVEIPDSIMPFVGVRGWLANKTLRDEERLFSVYKSIDWPIGEHLEAKCIQPASVWAGMKGANMFVANMRSGTDPVKELPVHDAPYTDCSCGIYALNSTLTDNEVKPWQSSAILGIVLLWGHVLEGERGWRAQYGRIVALLLDSFEPQRARLIQQMAETYRVPITMSLEEEIDRQRQLQGGVG